MSNQITPKLNGLLSKELKKFGASTYLCERLSSESFRTRMVAWLMRKYCEKPHKMEFVENFCALIGNEISLNRAKYCLFEVMPTPLSELETLPEYKTIRATLNHLHRSDELWDELLQFCYPKIMWLVIEERHELGDEPRDIAVRLNLSYSLVYRVVRAHKLRKMVKQINR